jgi:hypothetical protein
VPTPVPTPTPTPAPAFDALTFFNNNCKGCHSLGVRSAFQIQSAINSQSAMSSFKSLTQAQVAALAAASH